MDIKLLANTLIHLHPTGLGILPQGHVGIAGICGTEVNLVFHMFQLFESSGAMQVG